MDHDRVMENMEQQMAELDQQMATTRANIRKILAESRELDKNIHKAQTSEMCQSSKKTIKGMTQEYKVPSNRE